MKFLELFNKNSHKKVSLPKGEVKLYNSIHELPCDIFTLFQSYVIQDAGIGSTVSDLNNRFATLDTLISSNKIPEAIQERYNLHIGLFLGLEKINISHICFACLIHSINGKEIQDRSEDSLRKIITDLSKLGLTNGIVKDYLDEVKKNLIEN